MPSRARQRSTRSTRRRLNLRRPLAVTLGIVGFVIVCGALLFGYQAVKASSALKLAASQGQQLQSQVSAGNVSAARTTLDNLEASTGQAQSRTKGVLWDIGGHLPFIGSNVEAVQTVSRVLHTLSGTGLKPLVDAADSINSEVFSPTDGRVDIAAIAKISPAITTADQSLTTGRNQLAGIRAAELFGPLQAPIRELKSKLDKAQSAAASGSTAAQLMPGMLGDSGSRTYLLVIQNNAEIRSTGGMPGAFAVIKADNGKITLGEQGAGADFGYFDTPVVKLSKDEINLYTTLMATFWSDANFTPDFPRTGEIMRAMYEKRFGELVDGVISVDPIALSYLLKGTGPVELVGGKTVTSKNAVDLLLNQVYFDYPGEGTAQNDFFAMAASRVFDAVAAGKGDPRAVLKGMAKATGENRMLIWSNNTKEQAILAKTRVAGALPSDSGATPHVGVYLNDATATKLQYYLDAKTTMHTDSCTKDGIQTIISTTVLTSTVPKDATSLPEAVLGRPTGAKTGSMRMNLRFYAPYGGLVTDVVVGDTTRAILTASHHKRNVAIVPVLLKPGQTTTVQATMLTGRDQPNDPILSTTPGINPTLNNVAVASACGR